MKRQLDLAHERNHECLKIDKLVKLISQFAGSADTRPPTRDEIARLSISTAQCHSLLGEEATILGMSVFDDKE